MRVNNGYFSKSNVGVHNISIWDIVKKQTK